MNQIFQVQSYITKISTMANGLRLSIDTVDTLSPEAYKRLFDLYMKPGWLSFNVHQIEAENLIDLPPVVKKSSDEKTPSQRLRNIFFLMWKKNNRGYKEFEDFYKFMMENLINFYKDKLEE